MRESLFFSLIFIVKIIVVGINIEGPLTSFLEIISQMQNYISYSIIEIIVTIKNSKGRNGNTHNTFI